VQVYLSHDDVNKNRPFKQDYEKIVTTPKPVEANPAAPVVSETDVVESRVGEPLIISTQRGDQAAENPIIKPVDAVQNTPANQAEGGGERSSGGASRTEGAKNATIDFGHFAGPSVPQAGKPKEELTGRKLEMVSDRFNRRWYAVSPQREMGESQPVSTEAPTVSAPSQPLAEPSLPVAPSVPLEFSPVQSGGEPPKENIIVPPPPPVPAAPDSQEIPIELPQQPSQGGGVGDEKDESEHLITWEKADELGLKLPETGIDAKPQIHGFEPIDEL
jgi:hypothetical protein